MTDVGFRDDSGFAGRSVIVVGATGALGHAVARGLGERGALVTATGANRSKLDALEREFSAIGAKMVPVPRRPSSEEDADDIVSSAVEAFGRVDGLVVASGTNQVAPITHMSPDQFDNVMEANVRSTWLVCRAFGARALAQGDPASVVLVSSTRGLLGHRAGYSAYCTSKGAVNLLTRTLAAEWGAAKIRVNAVGPTVFRSDLTAWMYEDDEKAVATRTGMLDRIPLGRLAEPDDVVGPVLFFLSDASGFCTGQVLYVDGGYTTC